MAANRRMFEYDQRLHDQAVLHFPCTCDGKYNGSYRLLVHFYAYTFFADPAAERFYKRFVRDRLRYCDAIWCAASRIIGVLWREASSLPLVNNTRTYTAYHIRCGDFSVQYKHTMVPIEAILANTEDLLQPGQLLYLATAIQIGPISSRSFGSIRCCSLETLPVSLRSRLE